MAAIPPEVRQRLEQHPWGDTIARLVYYAVHKARRLSWQGVRDGHLPGGKEAADVVSQAIEAVLSGTRGWQPAQQPDLFAHLRGIVDSMLHHLATGAENQHVRAQPLTTDGRRDHHTDLPDPGASPAEMVLQVEEARVAEAVFWGFYASVDEEPLLQHILRCLVDGVDTPAAMAVRLGVTPRAIYNARKKLQRRWRAYAVARAQVVSAGGGTHHG